MRIALFTPTFLPLVGGTEVVTDALARHWNRMGHPAVVVALTKSPERPELPYPVVWWRRPHGLQWFPERTAAALQEAHRRHHFDVFCVNYGHPTGYGAVKLGRKLGIPTVVVSHGGDLYRGGKDRLRRHTWKRICYAYQNADGLVSISPYIEELIREINPAPRHLVTIPNGVDMAGLREAATRPADFACQRPFLLCLGNLNDRKGFGDAIAAYARVKTTVPDLPALVVVGDGALRGPLEAQAAGLGLGQDSFFMGCRTGNDKRWFMQNCRFGLMPSLQEGHPVVGLEYLALGKPIICSTNRAFDAMYTDGLNCYRVVPESPDLLAQAIVRMLGTDLAAMGRVSSERAPAFGWDTAARKYVEFFAQLCRAG